MDNENKELEPKDMENKVDEAEFDPTESEEFYNNLDVAIGAEDTSVAADAAGVLLADEMFGGTEEEASLKSGDSLNEDDLFAGVDAALAEQIEQEFGKDTEMSSTEEKAPNKFVSFWKAIPTWTKVLSGIILAVLISVGLLFGTAGGRKLVYKFVVGIVMGWAKEDEDDMGYISPIPELTVTIAPDITEEPDATPEPTATPTPSIKIMDDENIINVLLIGEENIHGANRGRADAIIVVSIDLNGGPLKMVSFQRDLYVAIPGCADDKLNAAYAYGGATLMIETIENNFGIDIDSYVKVGFDGFENIIDQLGGLRLSLTARESEYLNTTKYISKASERNTVAGYQTMTGAQVLGYCRVRYVPTAEGLTNDRGRNYRHRVVLQAIFEQYKEKSFAELVTVMRQCFDYVSVPSNLESLAVDCLQAVIENKMFEIETMQVPQSGKYNESTIGGKQVVVANLECVDLLQEFIYGD